MRRTAFTFFVAMFGMGCGPTPQTAGGELVGREADALTYSLTRVIAVAVVGMTTAPATCVDGTAGQAWKRYVFISARAGAFDDQTPDEDTALDIQTGLCEDWAVDELYRPEVPPSFTMTSVNNAELVATFPTPEGLVSADLRFKANDAMQTQEVRSNYKELPRFMAVYRFSERIRFAEVTGSATVGGQELLTIDPAGNAGYLDYQRETSNFVGTGQ
jgi:hypothetical protein